MPIIGNVGNGMKSYSVDNLLTQIKKVYAEKAVRSGFDDDSLYSDELLMLDNADVEAFKDLQKIVGSTKSEKIDNKVNVNNQGLTQEEYDTANRGEKKPKKQRTEEEQKAIDKKKELSNQRKTMISVLRGISIRIPMMIYGMPIDIGEDVDIDTFINNVDSQSWVEFMPKGVTKGKFKSFDKYYDADVFIEAGRIIRRKVKALDLLDPIQRAEGLATIFGSFKNPDKETVLTPWRVVNIHLGKTIGGLSFFDETYTDTTVDGVPANHWVKTDETESVFQDNVHILEINSKTGLYPLYAAISLYKLAFDKLNATQAGKFTVADQEELWQSILQKNIFVVAKTPMAKTITERTLAGYRDYKTNVAFVDGIVEAAKQSIDNGVKKVEESFDNMKFDVVIGNPPYQEAASGENTVGLPIYHHFYEMAFQLANKVTLITPARFLFNAGLTPSVWNMKMLNDNHFKVVYYDQDSSKIFPHTDIKGGVVITYHDYNAVFEPIRTFTSYSELHTIMLKAAPITPDESLASIIYTQTKFNLERLFEIHPEYKSIIGSNGLDRRFRNNIFDKIDSFTEKSKSTSDIKVLGLQKTKRVYKYIDKQFVDASHENLDLFKVLVPRSNGSGAIGEVLSTPLIGYTQTFIGIGAFKTQEEAKSALKYVKYKFARTMLGILKITQDNNRDTWAKVPLQDFTANSDIDWTKSVADIDQQLYAKYGLDDTEIQFIETHVKEMV